MWDVLDQLERTRRIGNSEVADRKSKVQRNCEVFVVLDVYQLEITDIYSLR